VLGDRCLIYDTQSGRKLAEPGPHRDLRFLAISHNGRWTATGAWGFSGVKIWETESGRLLRELPSGEFPNLLFSPDDRWLVVGTADGYQFWNAATWQRAHRIARLNEENIAGVMAFSPDARLMAAAHTRSLIKLYEPATGAEIASLESPNWQELSVLKFSHDGSRLVAARATYAVEMWDLRRLREELGRLRLDWSHAPYPDSSAGSVSDALTLDVKTEGASYLSNVPRAAWDLDVPPRPAEAGANQIDLGRYYNAPLTPSWQNAGPGQYAQGNDLVELPPGLKTLDGVRFDVRGVIQLASVSTVQNGDRFPKEVSGLPMGQRCRRLHFLHNAIFGWVNDGIEVARYVIHYEDWTSAEIPVVLGRDLKDFWLPRDGTNPASKAEIAWRGANEMSRRQNFPVGLFKFSWENPRPAEEIQSIDFVSAMNVPAPFLVAITAE
jgi:hypothetical protein